MYSSMERRDIPIWLGVPPPIYTVLDSPQLPLLRLPANLQAQILDVRIDNRRAPLNGLSGEIAIPAPLHAERSMQVESPVGIVRHIGPSLPFPFRELHLCESGLQANLGN